MQFTIDSAAAADTVARRIIENWSNALARGRALVVTIDSAADPRTLRQVRRYWKLLRYIAEHAHVDGRSYAAEHWDEFYKRLLVGVEDGPNGEKQALSTAEFTIGEYNDYMRQVEAHAAGTLAIDFAGLAP